ncbi:hypothetical protein ACQVWA_29295 [Bacillus cereus]|uniref:hypothetical protein n=1 Tax=Bacillus cereus TaxID=1396 RepID=UPI003D65C3B1
MFRGLRMIDETGKEVISGRWADVPRGRNRNNGTLILAYSGDQLTKVAGGIITTIWQRFR